MAVEKLDLSKLVEKTLRQEAVQTTFLVFLDIFYPPNFRCFAENGVLQQPQVVSVEKSQFTTRFFVPASLLVIRFFRSGQVHAVAICGFGLQLRNRTSRFRFCTVAAK